MLSGETAVGPYPVEAVSVMDTVLREAEAYQFFSAHGRFAKAGEERKSNLQDVLGIAVSQLSRDLMVRCVFVLTRSGFTARTISADRPAAPILAVTDSEPMRRRLNLLWGITPVHTERMPERGEYARFAECLVRERKLGKKGDYIIMVSGFDSKVGRTNTIEVHKISSPKS